MHEVKLLVNAREVSGWTGVRIRKGIEQIVDEAELEITDQRVNAHGIAVPTGVSRDDVVRLDAIIQEDDRVRLRVDGEVVFTGFADATSLQYDAQAATFSVRCSSRASDLVDSSAIYKTGAWTNATLLSIAKDLCAPYSIQVSTDVDVGEPFHRFKLEQGETVFDAISRACAMRGVLPVSKADGDVLLTRASTTSSGVVIELGTNVLACSMTRNQRERFSKYIFKGQTAASDEWSGKAASQLKHEVEDTGVSRYRPLVVIAPKQRTKEDLGKRAIWERNVRAGRSLRVTYTVPEWTTSRGKLWVPNMLVRVKDPYCRIDEELLTAGVEQSLDDECVTTLELVRPGAFDVYAVK